MTENQATAVKAYLSRYSDLNESIDAKRKQVEKLRERAQTVSGGNSNGVHNTLPYDKIGQITAKIVDLEREIIAEIDRSVDVQREIREVISAVSIERLRTILEKRYLNCMSFDEIAAVLHYSKRQIFRFHESALDEVKNVIECH